jgi:uncharacterized protein (TIGR03083 family)
VDTWQLIAAERSRLVDALDELTDQEWDAPSLCDGWRNRDALAHIVATAEVTPARFFAGMVRNGLNFHKMVAGDIAQFGQHGVPALLERFRAAIPSHDHPPGPVAAMLLETVVHGEDIVYPLDQRKVDHLAEGLVATAEFAKTAQPLVGCRQRIAGLRLRATDHEWATGAGPEVAGPLVALLLAMCGRRPALEALTGEGVAVLRERP